ncbi:unnamed protein product [Diamesa serratosioi]
MSKIVYLLVISAILGCCFCIPQSIQTRPANTVPKPSLRSDYTNVVPSGSGSGSSYSERTETRCVNGNCQEVVTKCRNGICSDNQLNSINSAYPVRNVYLPQTESIEQSYYISPNVRTHYSRNNGGLTSNNGLSRNEEQHTECVNGVCKTTTKICNNGNCGTTHSFDS